MIIIDRKRYLKDKPYRQQMKQIISDEQIKWINLLSKYHTVQIGTDTAIYIITPSFYDKVYQLTTFRSSDMLPLGHMTYNTISELINDNAWLYYQETKINEYILKEAI